MLDHWDKEQLIGLRKAIIDMLMTCLSSEENKEETSCQSLYYATSLIAELNKKLEDSPKQ